MFIVIPNKTAHIVDPHENVEMPGVPKTYCNMIIIAHGQYFRESYKGRICPECQRLAQQAQAGEGAAE